MFLKVEFVLTDEAIDFGVKPATGKSEVSVAKSLANLGAGDVVKPEAFVCFICAVLMMNGNDAVALHILRFSCALHVFLSPIDDDIMVCSNFVGLVPTAEALPVVFAHNE